MPNKSTTTNLLEAINYWTEHHIHNDVIHLDFSKALDKVAHQRLLKTLSAYQVDKKILNWIRSFLEDRP